MMGLVLPFEMNIAILALNKGFRAFLKVTLAILLGDLATAFERTVHEFVFAVDSMLLQLAIRHRFLATWAVLAMAHNHSTL